MPTFFDAHPRVRAAVLVGFLVLGLIILVRSLLFGDHLTVVVMLVGLPAFGYSLVRLVRSGALGRDGGSRRLP